MILRTPERPSPVGAAGRLSVPTARLEAVLTSRIVLLMGLHVPLGLLMHRVTAVATMHAVLTIAVATFLALGTTLLLRRRGARKKVLEARHMTGREAEPAAK